MSVDVDGWMPGVQPHRSPHGQRGRKVLHDGTQEKLKTVVFGGKSLAKELYAGYRISQTGSGAPCVWP